MLKFWKLFCLVVFALSLGKSAWALDVPYFSQKDAAWGNSYMGSSGVQVKGYGCTMTCTAMVLRYYGVDTNPGLLNSWLSSHGGYTGDGSLNWGVPATYSGGKATYGGKLSLSGNSADSASINNELNAGHPVIVKVATGSKTYPYHWVVLTGKEGSSYRINDPYWGYTSLSSFSNKIYDAAIYRGTTPPPTSEPIWEGSLDLPANGANVRGLQEISGWGWDKSGKYPIQAVEIYINGEHIANATYGIYRADLGRNIAFSFNWDTSRWAGQTVTVRARPSTGYKWFDMDNTVTVGFNVGQGSSRQNLFVDAYNRNGGASKLGNPAEATRWAYNHRVVVQEFKGGSFGDCTIFDDEDANSGAYVIRNGMRDEYYGMGGADSPLGALRSDERPANVSPQGTTGAAQDFEHGHLHASPHGVFWTINQIDAKYGSPECGGGSGGFLGFPISDEIEAMSSDGMDGWHNQFEGGNIWHTNELGTYFTKGGINEKYTALGSMGSVLGYPASDEIVVSTDHYRQVFHGGAIYSRYQGTWFVYGGMNTAYNAAGAWGGSWGWPLRDQSATTSSKGTAGGSQDFDNGTTFTSSKGTFWVNGAIKDKYAAQSWEKGFLGFPIGEAGNVVSAKTGKNGKVQGFEGGAIYTSAIGTFIVANGSIKDSYWAQLAEKGKLGLPISDAYSYLGGTRQNFEGGFLTTVTSNHAPVLKTATFNITQYSAFSQQLAGTDADKDRLTYRIVAGTLPAGLKLSTAGLIAGKATVVGSKAVTVEVADGKGGIGTAKITLNVTTAPGLLPPTTLRLAFDARAMAVNLSWRDRATGETGYRIERLTNGKWTTIARGTMPNQTSYVDKNVVLGATYSYRVSVYVSGVANGAPSNVVSLTLPAIVLTPPSLLTARGGTGQITLSWDDKARGETGYRIERLTNGRWSLIASGTTANQTSYLDGHLTAAVTYSYRVSAYASGVAIGAPSNVASAKTLGDPLVTPSALTASASANRVALQWHDNSSGETGFSVERRLGNSGTWREIFRGVAPNQNRWTDSSVSAGATYQYRVLAYKSGLGKGVPCQPVTVFVPLGSSTMSAPAASEDAAPSGDSETTTSDAGASSASGALKKPSAPTSGASS